MRAIHAAKGFLASLAFDRFPFRRPEPVSASRAQGGNRLERGEGGGLLVFLLFLAYLLLLSFGYREGSVVLSGDAEDYLRQSRFDLWDLQFWVRRPFVVPLFYRLFGPSPLTLVTAQVFFHAAAWGVLALSLAKVVRNRLLKGLALAGVLLFSLTEEVALWNLNLLSESVAHSLWALSLAALLLLTERAQGEGVRGEDLVVFLVFVVLWAFTRDTHAYVLLAAGLILAATAIHGWIKGRLWRRKALAAALFFSAFGLSQVAMESSERTPWTYSLTTVVCQRILPDGEARVFFRRQGMPYSAVLEGFQGKFNAYMVNRLSERPDSSKMDPVFEEWVLRDGRRVYMKFLLSHPATVLRWLCRERMGALSPVLDAVNYGIAPTTLAYLPAVSSSAPWLPLSSRQAVNGRLDGLVPLFRILYPPGEWPVWAALALALTCGLMGKTPKTWLPLVLWSASFVEAVVVVLADPGEIDRHAAGAAMGFRAALWLALLFLAVRLWEGRRGIAREEPPQSTVLCLGTVLPLQLLFGGLLLRSHGGDSYGLDAGAVHLFRDAAGLVGGEVWNRGVRALPLLWTHAFGANPLAYVLAQTVLLCASWAFLTAEVLSCLPGPKRRTGAALLLLGVGLTPSVGGWAYAVSPIAPALSATAFLLALSLRATRRWSYATRDERAAVGVGVLAAGLLLAGFLSGWGAGGGSPTGPFPVGTKVRPGQGLAVAFYRLESPPPRMSLPERRQVFEKRTAKEALFQRRFLPELSSDGRWVSWSGPARLAEALLFPSGSWVPWAALALVAAAGGLTPAKERGRFFLLGAVAAVSVVGGWLLDRSAAVAAAGEMAVRVAGWTGLFSLLQARPVFPGRGRGEGGRENR